MLFDLKLKLIKYFYNKYVTLKVKKHAFWLRFVKTKSKLD
jgi:hypothetical protein